MKLKDKIVALAKEGKLKFKGDHKVRTWYEVQEIHDADFGEMNAKNIADTVNMAQFFTEEFGPNHAIDRQQCACCGERISYHLEGDTIVPTKDIACFDADAPYIVEVQVPTGQLIMADYPAHGSKVIQQFDCDGDIGCAKGIADHVASYARGNVIHFFVGNSCPSVYTKDDEIYVGNPEYKETEDDEIEVPLAEGAQDRGSICTDLWWTTIVDAEIYRQLAEKQGLDNPEQIVQEAIKDADCHHVVLNVKPGTYRCTYYGRDNDENPSHVYAKIERIGDCRR